MLVKEWFEIKKKFFSYHRERSRSPRQSGEKDSSGCQVNDELSLVGFSDDTEISQLFESSGESYCFSFKVCN